MQIVAEVLQHLVQRPEDYLENIEHIVNLYKEIILHPLEVRKRYIAEKRMLILVFCIYVCQVALVYVQLFVTPWTVAHQAPLSAGFSRQE